MVSMMSGMDKIHLGQVKALILLALTVGVHDVHDSFDFFYEFYIPIVYEGEGIKINNI